MAELFSRDELEDMYNEAREYGFAFLSEARIAAFEVLPPTGSHDAETAGGQNLSQDLKLGSGALSTKVLSALFRTIPQDMTFVDAEDRVAFFTDRLKARISDAEAAKNLKQAGLHVQPLSQNYLEMPTRQGLVFGYGRLHCEDAFRLISRMAEVLGSAPPDRMKK